MSNRYVVVSGVIFGFVALAQVLRAVMQVPVQIGGVGIPVWASWGAAVLAGSMCTWAFASRKSRP
ncbi:hypothetical protein D3C83_246960 [compost metagenome]